MTKVSVKDLVVFVTGASRNNGIGCALIEEALNRGAKKVYATTRNASQLNALANRFPGKVFPVELDVTDLDQIKQVASESSDVQVLINNAGFVGTSGCIYNYDEQSARREMEVNYFGPLHLMNIFSEKLIVNGNGAIVNIVSIGGLYPSPVHATYSASKAALYSLTQAARIEMAMHGHTLPVFGVYPGPIDTDMAQGLDVAKESPNNLALRVFNGMEQGVLDITTDSLSDHFVSYLEKDYKPIQAMKEAFNRTKPV